jgi:hypothetical protein
VWLLARRPVAIRSSVPITFGLRTSLVWRSRVATKSILTRKLLLSSEPIVASEPILAREFIAVWLRARRPVLPVRWPAEAIAVPARLITIGRLRPLLAVEPLLTAVLILLSLIVSELLSRVAMLAAGPPVTSASLPFLVRTGESYLVG